MKYVGAAILCAIAATAAAQSKSDAAAVREAIRFERAKDAAAKRQVRRAPTPKAKESVADAVAFERAKDAAAARQARLDAQSSADRSVANAGGRK
jgi:hypothetical protein